MWLEFSDAQRRLLLAAERLFSERGVAHVSMREIASAAGQRNNYAVQYHFENKQTLLWALYDLRMAPLNTQRLVLLARCTDYTAEVLVDAFVRPLGDAVVAGEGRTAYARFLNRHLSEIGASIDEFTEAHKSGAVRIYRLLDDLLADLPVAERRERVHQMSRTVAANLADLEERLENGSIDGAGARRAVDVLIRGTAAAVTY